MLKPLSVDSSRKLRAFFDEAGYNEPSLRKYLGAAELPSRRLRNQSRLLDRTSAATPVNVLLRWFWLWHPTTEKQTPDLLPNEFLALLLGSGLLESNGDGFTSTAMLLPVDKYLVASDHPQAIENKQAEMVLWPNPTSKFLGRFAVRRRSRATLDLGTGGGILSLAAAEYSDMVVATDLNPRAVEFARFNARLNGVENIEVLAGDCFAPVADRKFDLILSNPPFFITPQTDYLFCENPMELDGLCRRLVKEAPQHLNEGGYMEMLCEWAQIRGQFWEDRVAEWLADTGCDAWVMKGLTQDPEEYAQHRIRETTGKNWVRIEEVPKTPSGDLGQMLLSTFAAHDLLLENEADDRLLALRPVLAPHVRLEQVCNQADGHWHAESLTLRLVSGFPFQMTVQPLVAEFLATCDGSRTAEQAIQDFAATANAPLEKVRTESLAMIRRLIERGFIIAN